MSPHIADPVADALTDIAEASFPRVYALPSDQPWGGHGVTEMPPFIPDLDQGRMQAFVNATADDPILSRIPGEGDGVFITSSTGAGWRTNRAMLASGLVASAAKYVSGRGRRWDEAAPLIEEVQNQLRLFRHLVNGERENALMLTAFDGLPLCDEARIETPWGTLRRAGNLDQWRLGRKAAMPTAVLESWVPITYTTGEPSPPSTLDDQTAQQAARGRQRIPLCGLLLSDQERLFAPGFVWQTVLLPGQIGGSSSGAHAPTDLEAPSGDALTDQQQNDLVHWASIVETNYHESIAVAVRRVISAIRERWDQADSLIDAVVAWENLFGGEENIETTFRITSALAILLEPTTTNREAKRKELSKIYGVRSRVLHGRQLRSQDRLEDTRAAAIQIAIEALQLLLSERCDLLADSSDRATRLILGASRPARD